MDANEEYDLSTFAGRVVALREAAGLSRLELACKAVIEKQNLHLWETTDRRPKDPDDIAKLALALGTTTDYLIMGRESLVDCGAHASSVDGGAS